MDIVNNNSVSESLLGQWSETKTGFRQFTFQQSDATSVPQIPT